MFLIVIGILVFLIWGYVLFVRPYLVAKYPEFGKFAAWEDTLYSKSRTILVAKGYWLGGILVGLHEVAAQAGLDVTPITDELGKFVPEQYRGLAIAVVLFATGIAFRWLRQVTTSSLDDK